MALAPSPTTEIDGVKLFAAPAKSGQPRNAFLVFSPVRGGEYRTEIGGGATREAAARKAARGDLIVARDDHVWTPTPYRKTPFAI